MQASLLLKDMAELLMVDAALLRDDLKLNSLGQWDSFTVVSMMGAINQYYQLVISADLLMQCEFLGDIFALIENQKMAA